MSGLFVGGATSNPLLASFASLIALLLWLNLSSQVILIASAYIVVGTEEDTDRVHAVHGATTLAQFRVRRAERAVQALPSMPKPEAPRGPLPPLDLEVPGATLRAHREHLGWTIEEVARRTRILCLEGIENESFDSVPPEPYIRGFVANYAQELRVSDPNAIAAAFVRRYRLATASRPAERKRSLG